jgi:hypothetical protein
MHSSYALSNPGTRVYQNIKFVRRFGRPVLQPTGVGYTSLSWALGKGILQLQILSITADTLTSLLSRNCAILAIWPARWP